MQYSRSGKTLFGETTSTANLRPPIEALVRWLVRDNPVPPGTVLSTGTGIVVPDAMALSDGDQVDVEVQSIGRSAIGYDGSYRESEVWDSEPGIGVSSSYDLRAAPGG